MFGMTKVLKSAIQIGKARANSATFIAPRYKPIRARKPPVDYPSAFSPTARSIFATATRSMEDEENISICEIA